LSDQDTTDSTVERIDSVAAKERTAALRARIMGMRPPLTDEQREHWEKHKAARYSVFSALAEECERRELTHVLQSHDEVGTFFLPLDHLTGPEQEYPTHLDYVVLYPDRARIMAQGIGDATAATTVVMTAYIMLVIRQLDDAQPDFDHIANAGTWESYSNLTVIDCTTPEDAIKILDAWQDSIDQHRDHPWFYNILTDPGTPEEFNGHHYYAPPYKAAQAYVEYANAHPRPGFNPDAYNWILPPRVYDEHTNVTAIGVPSVASETPLITRRPRGTNKTALQRFLMPTSAAFTAVISGAVKGDTGRYVTNGYLIPNPAGNNLNILLEGDTEMFLPALVKSYGILSLKTLLGAVTLWAEQTGGTKYNDPITVTKPALMKASGFKSNTNRRMEEQYMRAFYALTKTLVEVQKTTYGKDGKPLKDSKTYQPVIVSDQLTVMPGLFGDDPEYGASEIWEIRFYPGEFIWTALFGRDKGSKQFVETSAKLLAYDARRDEACFLLGLHYLTHLRINERDQKITRGAAHVCDRVGITPVKNNLSSWIDKFKSWHERLVQDELIGSVEFVDIGEEHGPSKRWEALQIVITRAIKKGVLS